MRKALKIMNPKFYNYISANSGHPIKHGTNFRLAYRIFDGIKKYSRIKKESFSTNNFKRTWLPIEYVIRNQMKEEVLSLKNSNEISSLDIIDMDILREKIDLWEDGKVTGDQTFFNLLIIQSFIRNINS